MGPWYDVAFGSFYWLFFAIIGFDKDGAEDLRHKLVGTKKWIGTAGVPGVRLLIIDANDKQKSIWHLYQGVSRKG